MLGTLLTPITESMINHCLVGRVLYRSSSSSKLLRRTAFGGILVIVQGYDLQQYVDR
jgi:hypothetical protein